LLEKDLGEDKEQILAHDKLECEHFEKVDILLESMGICRASLKTTKKFKDSLKVRD